MNAIRTAFAACAVASGLVSCFFTPQTYELTQNDSGSVLHVRVGDSVHITLDRDSATGYDWYPVRGAADMRIIAEEQSSVPEGTMKSQKRFYSYRVIGPGSCGISLELRKAFRRDAAPMAAFQILLEATGKPEEAATGPEEYYKQFDPQPMVGSDGKVIIPEY